MNKQPFSLTRFYGKEHILNIETELISIDIRFNQIEITTNSLFLYKVEEKSKHPTFHGYLLRKKNEELVKAIISYCERNMITIIKGEVR